MDNSNQTSQTPIEQMVQEAEPASATAHYPAKEFEGVVPFSDFVVSTPPAMIPGDHLTAGLAADFSTHIDNPVFKLPTADDERSGALPAAFAMYAPYYVGTGYTPEQIANDVAEQAASFLKRLDVQHGYDGYTGRMLSVLRRGQIAHRGLQAIEDRNIMFDVHDFLATITNRLHHIAPSISAMGNTDASAESYRTATHEVVDPYARSVVYWFEPEGYKERFVLPQFVRSDPADLVAMGWDFFDTAELRRGAEFAALAADKLGNPLVRSAVSALYIPPHARSRNYLSAR